MQTLQHIGRLRVPRMARAGVACSAWAVWAVGVSQGGCIQVVNPHAADSAPGPDAHTPETESVPAADAQRTVNKKPDVATAPDLWSPPPRRNPQAFPPLFTGLAIGNATGQQLVVRVRALRKTIALDCATVSQAPNVWLSRALFAPARTWLVAAGRAFAPVQPGDGPALPCTALLVDGSGLPMRLVFWQHADYPPTQVPSVVQGPPAGRMLALGPQGDGLDFGKHPAMFAAPPLVDAGLAPGCEQPDDGNALAWSEPLPQGDVTVLDVESAPNGCHALELLAKTGTLLWTVCLPPAAKFPFEPGDDIFASPLTGGHNLGPVKGLDLVGDGKRVRFGRGEDVVYFGKAVAKLVVTPACGAAHDACGGTLQPVEVQVTLPGQKPKVALPGGQVQTADKATLHLVRSFDAKVHDKACTGPLPGTRVVESVFVEELP
ncbi:MAG: hypothetical protein EXR79_10210 [Myxococcales bacterium]|nr:hypothetical protein [Myxococcales bacterium]